MFQDRFKTSKIDSWEQISYLISVNKDVREWYSGIQVDKAAESEMPESFIEAGISGQEWLSLFNERELIRTANKEYADQINSAVKNYHITLTNIESKRISQTLGKISPLTEISLITVNQLPTGVTFNIALETDLERRKSKQKDAIKDFQKKLIQDFRDGKYVSPF